MPPEALSWNDADDNNGYHEKLFVMDFDGTLSTELAMIKNEKGLLPGDEDDGACRLSNDGKPMPARSAPAAASSRRARRTSRSPRTS